MTLFLKEDAVEFADQETIKKVAKKFSEFINYPMYLYTQKQVTKQHEEDVIPEVNIFPPYFICIWYYGRYS